LIAVYIENTEEITLEMVNI